MSLRPVPQQQSNARSFCGSHVLPITVLCNPSSAAAFPSYCFLSVPVIRLCCCCCCCRTVLSFILPHCRPPHCWLFFTSTVIPAGRVNDCLVLSAHSSLCCCWWRSCRRCPLLCLTFDQRHRDRERIGGVERQRRRNCCSCPQGMRVNALDTTNKPACYHR